MIRIVAGAAGLGFGKTRFCPLVFAETRQGISA